MFSDVGKAGLSVYNTMIIILWHSTSIHFQPSFGYGVQIPILQLHDIVRIHVHVCHIVGNFGKVFNLENHQI